MQTVTTSEIAALKAIFHSDYQDSSALDQVIGNPVWSLATTKAEGGVYASLVQKGLIHCEGRSNDKTVAITEAAREVVAELLLNGWQSLGTPTAEMVEATHAPVAPVVTAETVAPAHEKDALPEFTTAGRVHNINSEDAVAYLRKHGRKVAAVVDGAEYGATYGGDKRGIFELHGNFYKAAMYLAHALDAVPVVARETPEYVAEADAVAGDMVKGPKTLYRFAHKNYEPNAGVLDAFVSVAELAEYETRYPGLNPTGRIVKITVSEWEKGSISYMACFWKPGILGISYAQMFEELAAETSLAN